VPLARRVPAWWRRLYDGSDEQLDNAHLMRMAGQFARRVRAFARAEGVPVIECGRGQRKHRIAEEYLATHTVGTGVFLILVARAGATVWQIERSPGGVIRNLAKKTSHVNHYSFHIMDPDWGHLTIKMSGHPPFGAQIMLNGHEYVACQARTAEIGVVKEGNCFTQVTDPAAFAAIADTLSDEQTIGRLTHVCERWIYSACLCFGLSLAEQQQSNFRYQFSVYQAEYSRNLLFRSGAQMERVFQRLIDRTRARLDVPQVRTVFGAKTRPYRNRTSTSRVEAMVETPRYDLTVFKVHFGGLTLKAYTKGAHVLRFEAIVHNTKELRCGRLLERFAQIIAALHSLLDRFLTVLDCVDTSFVADDTLDQLPLGSQVGNTRVGGVDLNKPRTRAVLSAVLALSVLPAGFTAAQLAAKVCAMTGRDYTPRQAAYDVKKLRGKDLLVNPTAPAAISPHLRRSARSPRWSSCVTRSSRPSWPASAFPDKDANPTTGPAPTSTTKPSART
jgi:hypothetical protein